MRLYGDEIYRQNVDTLFDMGKQFAELIKAQSHMELALEPNSNIVCFRYVTGGADADEVNKRIADRLLKDGTYYVVSTAVDGKFYLRVTLMNPLTDKQYMEDMIAKINKFAVE